VRFYKKKTPKNPHFIEIKIILMGIDYIPVLKLRKYQYFITNKTDKSLFFLGLVAMILYWHSGNQNIE
jgi:hypothetical protein